MRTMEETAQLAKTTMRRSRGAAVLLVGGGVLLLGLPRARAGGAGRAGQPEGEAVPLAEVAAAAVRDNPDASRVDLAVPGDLLVPWTAADDLADLLAELVDNAVAFSAPETRVRVGGRKLGPAYVLEITDRGLGMTDGELAAGNRRLAGGPGGGGGGGNLGPAYVLEITDRGLGMTDGELAAVNRRLAGDPVAGDDPSQRLRAVGVGGPAGRHAIGGGRG